MNRTDTTPLLFRDGEVQDAQGHRVAWPQFAVLGSPVAHSLSPRLHAAALAARALPDRYAAIELTAAELEPFLEAASAAGMRGLNLTLPHKSAVIPALGGLEAEAARIGAVNTLLHRSDGWHGFNTDAPGLALVLRRLFAFSDGFQIRSACVIGAGGAARSAVAALRELSVQQITVMARTVERATWAQSWGASVTTLNGAPLSRAQLVVQATPLGLKPEDPSPVDPSFISAHAAVMDLCYGDHSSRLLRACAARGCVVSDGLPLLVAQAALAFVHWFGGEPPLRVMAETAGLDWS